MNCNNLSIEKIKIENNIKSINKFTDFENYCYSILNSRETYNKKEIKIKYEFELPDNLIDKIIKSWKQNSTKFTKYNVFENSKDEKRKLILFHYENCLIYIKEKSLPLQSEYFIWGCDEIIARARESFFFKMGHDKYLKVIHNY